MTAIIPDFAYKAIDSTFGFSVRKSYVKRAVGRGSKINPPCRQPLIKASEPKKT